MPLSSKVLIALFDKGRAYSVVVAEAF